MDEQQQLQQQIVQLVQAAMQGDQQATQQIQQIMQAAQQGDQQAAQIAQMIQQVAQQMQQQQVRAAKFGAKLNYIRQLKGQCPEGYKMEYYKRGGQLCKRCMKAHSDGGEVNQAPKTVSEQFKMASAKCGKKMNKKENGGTVETEKCGGKTKLRKKACGGPMKSKIKSAKPGGTVREVRRTTTYPKKLEAQERIVKEYEDGTTSVLNSGWDENGMYRASLRGRQGEFGNTAGNTKQKQVADSLLRVDWKNQGSGASTVPSLKNQKKRK